MSLLQSLPARVNRRITRALPIKRVRSRLERPLASITFDDFPRSAWTTAGPILERYGAKATYFAVGSFCGQTFEGQEQFTETDLAELREAGHEIGCHTFRHESVPRLRTPALHREWADNAAFLAERAKGQPIVSFAYPYGDASPRTKAWCSSRYAVSRGIQAGVNAGTVDLAELRSSPLEARRWSPELVEGWVREAVRRNGWLVFFTHDISDDPSPYGATPAMLEHALEALKQAEVEILPIRAALPKVVFGRA
jgi:peptidoglycan/xylan/chitin deacetylase (PgdA/CDA1 family)